MTIKLIRGSLRPLAASACALGCLALACASSAVGDTAAQLGSSVTAVAGAGSGPDSTGGASTTTKPDATALLEQCVTALTQTERLATFAGEMTAIPNTARMEISIGLLERVPGETGYRAVSAPGLGAWRSSNPDVKSYTYIKQVADLAAPAFYRGVVRFRWLSAKGHAIKTEELRTSRCEQPAASAAPGSGPAEAPSTPAGTTTTRTSSG